MLQRGIRRKNHKNTRMAKRDQRMGIAHPLLFVHEKSVAQKADVICLMSHGQVWGRTQMPTYFNYY